MRVVGLVGVGLIVCVAVGLFVVARLSSKTFDCAGVGLSGPSGSTPTAALGAFLDRDGGDVADWKRGDHRKTTRGEVYDFTPRNATSQSGFTLVSVTGRDGTWRASGACVGAAR